MIRLSTLQTSGMAKYECPECGRIYDEEAGDAREGFAPGTLIADFPPDWTCPDCGVRDAVDYVKVAD